MAKKHDVFFAMTLRDQIGRPLHLKSVPQRIISLVPSQTELLVDLGLESYLVGVTKFCIHPSHLRKEKVVVGGTKQINIEKIKTLRPDIILCNKEENTKDIVAACAEICNIHVSDIFNIQHNLEMIHQYGIIFNKAKEASEITDLIKKEWACFDVFIQNKPLLNAVYFIWKNPWMIAANNTYINYMLALNRFKNSYEDKNRYPEITLRQTKRNNAIDVVMLSSEPFPFKESHISEVKDFYPNAQIIIADGEMFSWYGSRLKEAFKYFKNLRLNLEGHLNL